MVDAALWLIRLSHRQQRQRPRGFIQDYSTHGWPWVRVQGELLSTQMSCVQQEEEEEEKKITQAAFLCVRGAHLHMFVLVGVLYQGG